MSAWSDVIDRLEEESMTVPGLSGVLMTQLTWGANALDALLAQTGEARDRDDGTVAATDSRGETEGLVGTTRPPHVALLRDLDKVSDIAGPGVGAESSGAAAAADEIEGGTEEGEKGEGAGGSRRMTFTEVSAVRVAWLGSARARVFLAT